MLGSLVAQRKAAMFKLRRQLGTPSDGRAGLA